MPFIIQCMDGLFEKRTSTMRMFGGKFQVTKDINDAKRFTRRADADKRVNLLFRLCGENAESWRYHLNPHLQFVRDLVVKEI